MPGAGSTARLTTAGVIVLGAGGYVSLVILQLTPGGAELADRHHARDRSVTKAARPFLRPKPTAEDRRLRSPGFAVSGRRARGKLEFPVDRPSKSSTRRADRSRGTSCATPT
jgi:hypothetical protein